eukprot:TRINITY_DN14385_c3_g2_i1.p1 TRINITY_DN14385_c3_g2~~TRINITY_DN14385_c3_g2_i1.p1  ORF type:complete len:491 (+),score=59.08 TRINITY_DN14385_c3_g2_i1:54-1475(+)
MADFDHRDMDLFGCKELSLQTEVEKRRLQEAQMLALACTRARQRRPVSTLRALKAPRESSVDEMPTRCDGPRMASKTACMPRKAKAATAVEERLYGLLRRLSPEHRRQMLEERFSELQRLSLERWILTRRQPSAAARPDMQQSITTPMRTGSPCAMKPPAAFLCAERHGMHLDSMADLPPEPFSSKLHPWSRAGVCGIQSHRSGGRVRYCASAACGPFRLFTRSHTNLANVLKFLDVLLAVRRRTLVAMDASSAYHSDSSSESETNAHVLVADGHLVDDIGERFRLALLQEPRAHGLDAQSDMALRFTVAVAAKFWVGKTLATPRFPATPTGISRGVNAWRRLNVARQVVYCGRMNRHNSLAHRHSQAELHEAWSWLRSVYLDVWEESGVDRKVIEARLAVREQRHCKVVNNDFESLPISHRSGKRKHDEIRCGIKAQVSGSSHGAEKRIYRLLAQWKPCRMKCIALQSSSGT